MRKAEAPKRRGRRFLYLGLIAALLLYAGAVVVGGGTAGGPPRLPDLSAVHSASRSDPLLGRAVSSLAGRGAVARCWSHADWRKRVSEYARRWPEQPKLGPWAAYASYDPAPAVNLSPEVCLELTRLAHSHVPVRRARWPDALARSVQVLAHESEHVAGFLNEAAAECYGMQAIPRATAYLGRTREEGRFLAELYWKRWYRWDRPAYRSDECRNGGALDLLPAGDVWP